MNYKYIDSTDQPSDPNGNLGKLRRELRSKYNSNRLPENAATMTLLRATLTHVVELIDAGNVGSEKPAKPEVETKENATPNKVAERPTPSQKPTLSKD